MKSLFLTFFLIVLSSCEFYSQRTIENHTKYDVWIELYKIPALLKPKVSLADTIKSFSKYVDTYKGKDLESTFFGISNPRDIDSVVLNFINQDTIYRKVYLSNDTSDLLRCLINLSLETCFIEERHLEGATLIVK